MPAYAYRAVDAQGQRVRGKGEAGTSETLIRTLESSGLLVLEVEDAETTDAQSAPSRLQLGSRRSVLQATRTLAALLPTGMSLPAALIAASRITGGPAAQALDEVRRCVERGDALAVALARHPNLFSPVYVGVVRAGEKSGDLAAAFSRLADQLERQEQLRSRLLSASIYPLILASLGGLSVAVLLLFVIPRFVDLLQGAGAALPRSTAFLLGVSSTIREVWPLVPMVLLASVLALMWLRGREEGRRAIAVVLDQLPLARSVRRSLLAGQFARLVGVLLGGGAPLLAALEDASGSLADPLAKAEAERVRVRVREGASLHATLSEGRFFPELLAQLVAVGEESGRLQEFLLKAAEIFEERTDRTMQRLVTLAEPAMILAFGGMVAFVAFSLLQAIYSVNAGAFR